jgi:hypothetical protein
MPKMYDTTNLTVHTEDEITITSKKKKPKLYIPFQIIGRTGKMKAKESYPLLDVMSEFSSQEHWFFKLLRDNLNYKTSQAVIINKSLSASEVHRKTVAFKALRERDLVKRVCRETYMINPKALIYLPTLDDTTIIWNKLT